MSWTQVARSQQRTENEKNNGPRKDVLRPVMGQHCPLPHAQVRDNVDEEGKMVGLILVGEQRADFVFDVRLPWRTTMSCSAQSCFCATVSRCWRSPSAYLYRLTCITEMKKYRNNKKQRKTKPVSDRLNWQFSVSFELALNYRIL